MRKTSSSILFLLLLGVAGAAQAILDGVEDMGDQIRAVVNINGCSGTLISDRVVLTSGHCNGREGAPGGMYKINRMRVPPLGQTEINAPGGTTYYIEGWCLAPVEFPMT